MNALGMRVIATRGTGNEVVKTAEGTEVYPAHHMHKLLPLAKVLIVCLPATNETDGLISSVELDLLPKGAVLVNVGRGAVVKEEALQRALKPGGTLLSAGNPPPAGPPPHTLNPSQKNTPTPTQVCSKCGRLRICVYV